MSQTYQSYQTREGRTAADLKTMVRNNYYYGKLLDVFHLEMEQEYFNAKRRLLNRLVTGPGVVCGLDVVLSDDGEHVYVTPGLAIDRHGNEIIVPARSRPIKLPDMPDYDPGVSRQEYRAKRQSRQELYCEMPYAHVVICYHECPADPAPAMGGECEAVRLCASGAIREQYIVEVREGFAAERRVSFLEAHGGRIDYDDLVEFVTRTGCRALPEDGCLPLANIHLKDAGDRWRPEIDISVRSIVYTNRLLYHLLLALTSGDESHEHEI